MMLFYWRDCPFLLKKSVERCSTTYPQMDTTLLFYHSSSEMLGGYRLVFSFLELEQFLNMFLCSSHSLHLHIKDSTNHFSAHNRCRYRNFRKCLLLQMWISARRPCAWSIFQASLSSSNLIFLNLLQTVP